MKMDGLPLQQKFHLPLRSQNKALATHYRSNVWPLLFYAIFFLFCAQKIDFYLLYIIILSGDVVWKIVLIDL